MFSKTNYIVKAGKHKARGLNFGINWTNKVVNWTFRIDNSWWYRKNEVEHTGVNKVCGITFGLFPRIKKYNKKYSNAFRLPFNLCYIKAVHWNSFRLGTQPEFREYGRVWLYYYCYRNGIRRYDKIVLGARGEYNVSLSYQFNTWMLVLGGKKYDFFYRIKPQLGYFCFPYFGGKSLAHKDWKVYLKRW